MSQRFYTKILLNSFEGCTVAEALSWQMIATAASVLHLSFNGPQAGRPAVSAAPARSTQCLMIDAFEELERRNSGRGLRGLRHPNIGFADQYDPQYSERTAYDAMARLERRRESDYYLANEQPQYQSNEPYFGSIVPTQGTIVPTPGGGAVVPMQSSAQPAVPPHVEGLSSLVEYLSPEAQDAALEYCIATDTPSVQVLVLMEQDEAFIAALGAQPGGNIDNILRDRFQALRRALGAKSFDRRPMREDRLPMPEPLPPPASAFPPSPYPAVLPQQAVGPPYLAAGTGFDGLNHGEYHERRF